MTRHFQAFLSSAMILGTIVCSTSLQAQDGQLRTELMASFCFSCHGQGGKGALKMPPLNDLKSSDIKESMIGFKSGDERSTVMEGIAKDFSKEDIILLANYFEALPD